MTNLQHTTSDNTDIIADITPSVITYTLPEISTPEGRELATKMANNIKNGTMDPNNIPNKYRTYIEATLNGKLAIKEKEDAMRIDPVILTAGIEPLAVKGLMSNIATAPIVALGSNPTVNESESKPESKSKPESEQKNNINGPTHKSWSHALTIMPKLTLKDMQMYRMQQMTNYKVPRYIDKSEYTPKDNKNVNANLVSERFGNHGEFIRIQLPEQSPIEKQLAKTTLGKHVFKTNDIQVKYMQALLDEAAKYGIYFRITSGYRKGAKTKSGKLSWHGLGHAIDITPVEGQSWEDLKRQILNSPGFVKWMQDHGYGILDETTPEMLAQTGGTGAHWHIGKDRRAIRGLRKMLQES